MLHKQISYTALEQSSCLPVYGCLIPSACSELLSHRPQSVLHLQLTKEVDLGYQQTARTKKKKKKRTALAKQAGNMLVGK